MKSFLKKVLSLVLISVAYIHNPTSAQNYSIETGATGANFYQKFCGSASKHSNKMNSVTSPCNGENTFWGFDKQASKIMEFELSEGVIAYTGNFLANITGGLSLAICDNLNGGTISPTFYCGDFGHYYYWDNDTSWIQTSSAPILLFNIGGYKNFLYSLTYPADSIKIIRYDGITFTGMFTLNKKPGCADIAVDTSGNIYLITKPNSNAIISDSLYVISPFGQILKQYSVQFKINHPYGCFLLNNILYVGFGESHPDYPNTLLPLTITDNAAIMGSPIPLPLGIVLDFDLASCHPNRILHFETDSSSLSYPNIFSPNNDGVNDAFAAIEKNILNLNCKIYNRYGAQVAELKEVKSVWDGHTTSGIALTDGVYFYIASGLGKDGKEYVLHGFVMRVR